MSNRILVVTQQGEARFLTTESVPTRVITIQPTGARGTNGTNGAGVAAGGSTNDILKKTSSTNYATAWETPTSAATSNAIVRRDASGGAAFGITYVYDLISSGAIRTTGSVGDIYTEDTSSSVKSTNFAPYDEVEGSTLRFFSGAICLQWGASGDTLLFSSFISQVIFDTESYFFGAGAADAFKTALAIASADITDATSAATANAIVRRDASGGAAFVALTGTGDWSTTGHFLSNPGSATAGHFVTKNGTAPTIVAGRSAWFSDATGVPQFRNGTGSALTLIYNGGAIGTPLTGTLTNCIGLPVSTGISGLGTNVAAFLATPTSANLRSALTDETGTGAAVFATSPTIATPKIVEIKNTAGTTSLNTDTAVLSDLDFSASIDFQNRWLYGIDATWVRLDWSNCQLNDTSGNISLDWTSRNLSNENGSLIFDYTGTRNAAIPLSFDGSGNVCLTQKIAYYNNFATAGNGQPAIRAVNDSTTNAAAKTATTLYAVPAANGGSYRISFVAKVTRAATTSSVLGGTGAFQAIYTDADDSVVVTTGAITNVSGATLTGNTTQIVYSGTVTVNAKASTNIQFTFGYTSVGATSMQYNLHVRCEQI